MSKRTIVSCDWCGYEEPEGACHRSVRHTSWKVWSQSVCDAQGRDLCRPCREHLAGVIDAARYSCKADSDLVKMRKPEDY